MRKGVFTNKNNLMNTLLVAVFLTLGLSMPVSAEQSQSLDMDKWLKARFGAQHEKLIPIVAVADMYFSCQKQKHVDEQLTVKALVTQIDRNTLAEKLIDCLAGVSLKSDVALNYGLLACFQEQLSDLSAEDKKQKMKLVTKAISSLSRAERQQSFTKCVTEQAIDYLQ
jgi:hypothetical protein